MKVGFTGTQVGMTAQQRIAFRNTLLRLNPTEFHHGDCIGADKDANAEVNHFNYNGFNITTHIYPPADERKRAFCEGASVVVHPKEDYLARNRRIVVSTDVLIATPKSYVGAVRSGTWYTVRFALQMGKTVYFVFPDGRTEIEGTYNNKKATTS